MTKLDVLRYIDLCEVSDDQNEIVVFKDFENGVELCTLEFLEGSSTLNVKDTNILIDENDTEKYLKNPSMIKLFECIFESRREELQKELSDAEYWNEWD